MSTLIHGYRLKLTCFACPEQYEVYDDKGNQVAYFRLRHGTFTASVPDYGAELVYKASTIGDGTFTKGERLTQLTAAIVAVQDFYVNEHHSTHRYQANWV